MGLGTFILVCLVMIGVGYVMPRREQFVTECDRLVSRMRPHILKTLKEFVELEDWTKRDAEFWLQSRGLEGLVDRWRNMKILVRICQLHYSEGLITKEDLALVIHRSNLLAKYSILAILESMVCLAWREMPRAYSRTAFNAYAQLSLRSVTLCTNGDTLECVSRLSLLL
jgi:hypothetical protein